MTGKCETTGFFISKYPMVLGSDIVGPVAQLEWDVKNFKEGDKVVFQGSVLKAEGAGCQEYSLVDAKLASLVPDNIRMEDAATLPAAAYLGFFARKELAVALPGSGGEGVEKEAVLVLDGASHTGRFGLQVAKLRVLGRL